MLELTIKLNQDLNNNYTKTINKLDKILSTAIRD